MSTIFKIDQRYRVRVADTEVNCNYTIGEKASIKLFRGSTDITASCTIVNLNGTALITIPRAQLGTIDAFGYTEIITYVIEDNAYNKFNTSVEIAKLTTVTTGAAFKMNGMISTAQFVLTGTGTLSATAKLQVSNNGVDWITAGSVTLDNSAGLTDGFAVNARWQYARAKVTEISGTNATVSCVINA